MAVEIQNEYRLGEYTMVPGTRTLSRDGSQIHLTGIPFQVFLYLIENRDRLVGREELLDRFWEGREVYEASLTKAVGAIRKALDDPKDQPRFIETRYGEGYRYIGPYELLPLTPLIPRSAPVEAKPIAPGEPAPQAPPRRRLRRVLFPLGIALGLLFALAAMMRTGNRQTEAVASMPPAPSIAILPLKNLSGDPAQDYFSDGVAESLMTELAKVRDLKVIARNSAFAFKGKETDVREIGRRLGVAAVLEGSLRRDEASVRMTMRLLSAQDGSVLWTGDMVRPSKDILKLQDEIGCSVAETLKTILCRDPNHRPGTGDLAAYDVYLKARQRRLKGDPKQAAALFEQAVRIDPNYALAWAGLAESYTVMEVNAMVPPRTMTGQARECTLKAIAVDASLAAPYAALGLLTAFSDRDWASGERYFRQALELNPNYAIAHAWYANTLLAQGKFAEAESRYLRAHELDPLNPGFLNNLAETYHYWRKPDQCLARAARALELDPGNDWAELNQAKCYTLAGRYEEALRVPLPPEFKSLAECGIYAQSGRTADARRVLPQVLETYRRTSPYVVAVTYAVLGENEAAFAWLQKSADQQESNLTSLKIEPAFEGLRGDPRYAELLRRVGLTP